MYQFSGEELWRDWNYSELYPSLEELRAFFRHVDQKLGPSRDTPASRVRSSTPVAPSGLCRLVTAARRGRGSFRRMQLMTDKPVKTPGPDHPISIEPNRSRVVVKVGGKIVADTSNALTLREASYPPVQYIPRRDVDMAALTRSEHTTYCPYKGDASYYSIPAGGDRSVNAVWTYENPFEAMARIKNYIAFYPDRVDEIS
jgi:uncharacterized protein (DUF427 family)